MCQLSMAVPLACLVAGDSVVALAAAARTARERGWPMGHVLLCGPRDPSKAVLARYLAGVLGSRLHRANAPLVRSLLSLVNLLAGVGRHDVLYVDEFHLLPPAVGWALREALLGFRLKLSFNSASESRTIALRFRPFTLIGATGHPGLIPQAFLGRFGHIEYVGGPASIPAPAGASPPRSPAA
jgi:Holliday junction DNA helicase RuvB